MRLGALDQARLAGLGIDRPDHDIVLPAIGDFLAAYVGRARTAIGLIDEAAGWMDMDRAGGLAGMRLLAIRIADRAFVKQRLGGHGAVELEAKHGQAVFPFQRDIDKAAIGMEIQMPRAKAQAIAVRGNGLEVGKLSVLEAEDFDMAGVFRLAGGGVIAA